MSVVELPPGWVFAQLAEITGPRGEKLLPAALPEAPFIGMDHIEAHTGRKIGSVLAKTMKSNASRFFGGDVLYGRLRPYLNKVWFARHDGLASAEFMIFPTCETIDGLYLSYRLRSRDFVSFAAHLNEGDRPRVGFDQLGVFEVALPPFAEQKRIVAKIEELFTKLEKGIESLRDAQAQLKLYRQSSIDFALRNPEGIELTSTCLGDVIGTIDQGWSPKCDYNLQPEPGQWAVITTTAIQPQKYLPNECKPLPADLKPRQKIEVQQGDILMTRKGPRKRTGVVCRVREHRARSMLCDTVYRFRAKENVICPDFLEILLNSPSVVAQIDRLKSGISDSGISLNQGKVKSVELTIPREIEAQRQIYGRVQTIEDSIVRVEAEIETQLAKADALRQSILKQAFSGKLVPQNPNDEPASILLDRIRAERAGAKPSKRKARPRKAKEAA